MASTPTLTYSIQEHLEWKQVRIFSFTSVMIFQKLNKKIEFKLSMHEKPFIGMIPAEERDIIGEGEDLLGKPPYGSTSMRYFDIVD